MYPEARLTYLVEPQAAPVVEANPHLDDVIVAPLPGGLARWRADVALGLRLRRERFDIVVDFHGGPRSSWLTLATGAPVRVGYAVQGRGRHLVAGVSGSLTNVVGLPLERLSRLLAAIREVLSEGIRRNGASIDWVYRGGDFQNHFRVYGRAGAPCPNCGTPIERLVVGQRGTHICPMCQRSG